MTRSILILLLSSALALAAPTLKPARIYFPTTVGDTRVYESSAEGIKTSEQIEIVESVEKKDDMFLVTTIRMQGKTKRPYMQMKVTEQGLTRVKTGTTMNSTPIIMLKVGARVGETWEHEVDAVIGKYTCKIIAEEELEVPAGKFKTIRVDTVGILPTGKEVKLSHWFAPGIGPVKMITNTNGKDHTQVLKSFTSGKK
jgi:hypothetical protein